MAFPIALAAAGASLVGDGINALAQSSMNRKTRKWSEKMWNQQNAVNDANWHRDNAYNSPANQRKLFQEAGLSEAMMYDGGSGGFQSASAPAAPTASAPHQESVKVNPAGAISAYANAQMMQPQLDNIRSATINAARSTDADVTLKAAQAGALLTDTGQKTELFDRVKEAMDANLAKVKADTALSTNQGFKSVDERQKVVEEIKAIKADTARKNDLHPKEMELMKGNIEFQKFKNALAADGFTEHDSVLWRLFSKFGGTYRKSLDYVPSKAPDPRDNPNRK